MRSVRARITGIGPTTPVTALAAAEGIDAVDLLAGGVADNDVPTYSLSIVGEEATVRAVLEREEAVETWDVAGVDGDTVYAYVRFNAPPGVSRLREHLTRDSLVVLLPATFHADGSVELTVVGTQSDLSSAFEELPGELSATVLEVATYRGGRRSRRGVVTDRQREVLRVAYDLGYYETPSRASQADVAAALELSTSTVGEHLQKGEARLVAALFE